MKKHVLAAAVVAAAAVTLTGCSDPTAGGDGNADAPADWPAQDADLAGTTLTIWAAQNSNTVPESVVSGFEELTGAEVEVVTIPDPYEQGVQTKVATGDMPDLAFWQPTASQLTALNAPTNLQPLDGAPWLDAYSPGIGDIAGSLDDTRYAALITTPAVEGVYYNKEVFAEAGITGAARGLGRVRRGCAFAEGRRRYAVLRLRRGRQPMGDPVVGAGAVGGCRCRWPVGQGERR